jgi:TPR repeat protein
MNRALIALIMMFMSAPAFAGLYDEERLNTLYKKERNGIRAYDDSEYETAFKYLSDTASKGLKESQYLVSIMFMQGQGTNKSVLFGLAWLGVATESGNEDWQSTFDTIYMALSEAQRTMVDEKIREYAKKYGSATQGVTCAKRATAGSRRIELRCAKNQGNYPEHDVELALTR